MFHAPHLCRTNPNSTVKITHVQTLVLTSRAFSLVHVLTSWASNIHNSLANAKGGSLVELWSPISDSALATKTWQLFIIEHYYVSLNALLKFALIRAGFLSAFPVSGSRTLVESGCVPRLRWTLAPTANISLRPSHYKACIWIWTYGCALRSSASV